MLTVSMSVRFGLSNGAIDIVEDFINLNDRRPPPLSDVMVNIPKFLILFYLSTPKLFLLFPLNVKLTAHAEFTSSWMGIHHSSFSRHDKRRWGSQ